MASFDEVKDVSNRPEVYLIDVRNKDEITSTGAIPCSINIPRKVPSSVDIDTYLMQDLENAFLLSDNDFEMQFHRSKPSKDAPLIFSCLRGGRAQRASDFAVAQGFKNVKPYLGSWTEWAQKQGL